MVFAMCSMAISILTWSSRTSRVDVRNLGIVFPLYHYHRHFQNDSHGMGGRARSWRLGNKRGIQGEAHSDVRMPVLGGHRRNKDDMYLDSSFQCVVLCNHGFIIDFEL
jgi:hypothetical protein